MNPAVGLGLNPSFRQEAFHRAMVVLREQGAQNFSVRHAVLLAECAADFLALSVESRGLPLDAVLSGAIALWHRHGAQRAQLQGLTEAVLQLANDTLDDVAEVLQGEQVVLH